jgi:hypothetical protein
VTRLKLKNGKRKLIDDEAIQELFTKNILPPCDVVPGSRKKGEVTLQKRQMVESGFSQRHVDGVNQALQSASITAEIIL